MATEPVTAHDLDAERAALGILIQRPDLLPASRLHLGALDPAHGHDVILGALCDLVDTVGTPSPPLLLAQLRDTGQLRRVGREPVTGGPYLHELIQVADVPINLRRHLDRIAAAELRRTFADSCAQGLQAARTPMPPEALRDRVAELAVMLGVLADEHVDGAGPPAGLTGYADFLAQYDDRGDWVIPALLARGDRVLLVAGEGAGKSELARQIAVAAAAGLHPFAPRVHIPPRRVLLVDLENPQYLVRSSLTRLDRAVAAAGRTVGDRLSIWSRLDPLDLRESAGRQLLASAVQHVRPDLLCIGPLYKLSQPRANDSHEAAAVEVTAALDRIRQQYGCAVWVEGHMAKGPDTGRRSSNPYGSVHWLRWPEFGIALRPAEKSDDLYELDRNRLDRDARAWPDRLRRDARPWPWEAIYDDPLGLDEALNDSRHT